MKDPRLDNLARWAQENFGQEHTGHDLGHIRRVVSNTEKILRKETLTEAQEQIVLAAAWLHEALDDKFFPDTAAARASLTELLKASGYSADKQEAIEAIVQDVSFHKRQKKAYPLLTRIVQDADLLEAIGAIGIGRAFYFGGAHHEPLASTPLPQDPWRSQNPKTVYQHFFDKLFRIEELLSTAVGREIGEKRTRFMKEFLTEFKKEWEDGSFDPLG